MFLNLSSTSPVAKEDTEISVMVPVIFSLASLNNWEKIPRGFIHLDALQNTQSTLPS